MGFIVQRFSVHYLLGDRNYRKYFALLTITTIAGSGAWLSSDLRLLLICWGMTLLGLTLIIRLKKEWRVAKHAAFHMGVLFTISWLLLLFAILWVSRVTGQWQLSQVMIQDHLSEIESWERTCIQLLLIFSVLIPAGQWPFQRWLLDSAVAPTPVSAVMHAGISERWWNHLNSFCATILSRKCSPDYFADFGNHFHLNGNWYYVRSGGL